MRILDWVKLLSLLGLLLGPLAMGQAAAKRPNVLFFFVDDQSYDTVGALGNSAIETPAVDSLVQRGVAFERAYIMGGTSPAVCSPSRAALFSGRTLWNLENQGMWGFEISEKYKTLPQVFREGGYETFATGKNEPGKHGHFARSFSSADKILFRGMTRDQYQLPLYGYLPAGDYAKQKATMHTGKHSAEVYADACIAFLEQQTADDKPFFAYLAFQTPHDPRQAPEEYLAKYPVDKMALPASFKPEHPFDNGMLKIRDEKLAGFPRKQNEVRRHLAEYYAMITHTDAQIGRVLAVLERRGLAENTIVVFTADNGLAVGQHGLMGKQNVYEHSVRVPFVVAGPGIPQGEKREQLCYIYDVNPTLMERAGLTVPETVQYKSLNPVLKDAKAAHRDHLAFAFMDWQRSVRDQRYKLIEYCVGKERHTQLFDLKNDGKELNNLAGNPEYAEHLARLRQQLQASRRELKDGNTPSEFTTAQGKKFWSIYESVTETATP